MSWTSGVGRACGVLLDVIVRLLALSRINPNVLTLMGLVVNTYAAFLFGYANGDNQRRMFFYAGLVIIGSGFFDLVDGRVARAANKVTRFGGFFDSVVDRYSDASLFFGLLVFYARGNRFFYVVLTALVMISAIMVSYARARAESLIGTCRVGFMERPERLVLLIIGALFNVMAPVLWVMSAPRKRPAKRWSDGASPNRSLIECPSSFPGFFFRCLGLQVSYTHQRVPGTGDKASRLARDNVSVRRSCLGFRAPISLAGAGSFATRDLLVAHFPPGARFAACPHVGGRVASCGC